MEQQTNPLLDFSGLPRFGAIEPIHVTPAVDALLRQARDVVRQVTDPKTPAAWDTIVEPLDDATDRLGRAWGAVSHLNAVVDTPELREQYNANQPKLTAFFTELSQNEALYARFKELAALPDFASWPAARRKVVENELRDFRLGGAELPADRKPRFKELAERESQVSTRCCSRPATSSGRSPTRRRPRRGTPSSSRSTTSPTASAGLGARCRT